MTARGIMSLGCLVSNICTTLICDSLAQLFLFSITDLFTKIKQNEYFMLL